MTPETEQLRIKVAEQQEKLIYSIIVAGKSATFTDAVMKRLMRPEAFASPYEMIRAYIRDGCLEKELRAARTGNYTKLAKCLTELVTSAAAIDFQTCRPQDLEHVHGIGPKTSRFFIMWIRPNERYAALDVHILRWLRAKGHKAPKTTPSYPLYAYLETIFIAEADALGMTARELDYKIWAEGSKYAGAIQTNPKLKHDDV